MSPREANLLTAPPAGKVQGVGVHHFYAFFSREARENDYLWGRLDAAEQLIRLLFASTGSSEPLKYWCQQSFNAILAEETSALKKIPQTLSAIGDQVAQL